MRGLLAIRPAFPGASVKRLKSQPDTTANREGINPAARRGRAAYGSWPNRARVRNGQTDAAAGCDKHMTRRNASTASSTRPSMTAR